jgi:alpha-2-macroglobulin
MADLPAYLQEEVEKLTSYKYECNEQLASKLIGLLIGDQLAAGALQRARNDRQINRLLKALMDSRNSDGILGMVERLCNLVVGDGTCGLCHDQSEECRL